MNVLHVGRFRLAQIDRQWREGLGPSHPAHAVSELRRFGHGLRFFDLDAARSAGRIGFQLGLLKELRRCDVVLAHDLAEIGAVAALRALGLVRVPIVAFVHSVPAGSAQKLAARGADLLLTLNAQAAHRLRAAGVPAKKVMHFDFGADLGFYAPQAEAGRTVLSVGAAGHDLETLVNAARYLRHAEVVIVGELPEALQRRLPPNVRLAARELGELAPQALQALYDEACVVAVTHHGTEHPHGLNATVEAMAMARPVVLTESRGIDIDPAEGGFGARVPPHDARRLAHALAGFVADPLAALRSGLQAHAQAVRHFNSHRMACDLARALAAAA